MAEISLILTSPGPNTQVTSIALADNGTGVSSISQDAINTLADVRNRIEKMIGGGARMTSNELRQFGQTMGEILFSKDVAHTWNGAEAALQAAAASAPAKGPPLITKILATSAELKAIPWEYASWPNGSHGPQLMNSVVRLVPQARANVPAPLQIADGLRVLLLSASPLGLAAIPWSDLSADLLTTFSNPDFPFEVILDDQVPTQSTFVRIVEAATRPVVQKWMTADQPHIVHFVGHGTAQGLSFIDSRTNRANQVTATALQPTFQRTNSVRLLILSACDTAKNFNIAPVDASIGTFAEQMVRDSVPAVIASQMVIDKETIAAFCSALYKELLVSGSLDLAVAAGRCHVAEELDRPDSAAIEWGIPILYRRLGAAQFLVRGGGV